MDRQTSQMNMEYYWDKLALTCEHVPDNVFIQVESLLLRITQHHVLRRDGKINASQYLKNRNYVVEQLDILNREYYIGFTGNVLVSWLEKINTVWFG